MKKFLARSEKCHPKLSKVVFGGRFRVNVTFWRSPLFATVTKWQSRYLKETIIYFWNLPCKAPIPHCQKHSTNNKWKFSLFRCLSVSRRRKANIWHDRTGLGGASKPLNRIYPSGSRPGCIKKLKSENLCFRGDRGVGGRRKWGRVRKARTVSQSKKGWRSGRKSRETGAFGRECNVLETEGLEPLSPPPTPLVP